ncbi:MAG TPA: hypothetical protein VMV10_10125 [Pirellulales bacterium]|nr:hypothetical protein [Pirellulales bacterium]
MSRISRIKNPCHPYYKRSVSPRLAKIHAALLAGAQLVAAEGRAGKSVVRLDFELNRGWGERRGFVSADCATAQTKNEA